MIYRNRDEAGARLGEAVRALLRDGGEWLVLALPRGGVPVAKRVADALDAPLDVYCVRKLGVPGHEEFAMGAIAPGGTCVLDELLVDRLGIGRRAVERIAAREQLELERREATYRPGREPLDLRGRRIVLVDDGLATGATMRAAVESIRARGAADIVVAVPVGSAQAVELLREVADEVICVEIPEPFRGVGMWYSDFGQTSDAEVMQLLARPAAGHAPPPAADSPIP
ncbi:MAG TPA: phosphoribosyltransferase [Xanthomonadales bacterium]|nr:phosphoribosyltransferase [Xanthomonadales bacterium]